MNVGILVSIKVAPKSTSEFTVDSGVEKAILNVVVYTLIIGSTIKKS